METGELTPKRLTLERLQEQLFLLKRRINRLKKDLGEPPEDIMPKHHCKRCGHDWIGRFIHRLPTACPRCHSSLWFEEGHQFNRKYRPARRPTDPPNPNWRIRKSDDPTYALPPPPKSSVSLSEQLLAKRYQEAPQPERMITHGPVDPATAETVVEASTELSTGEVE